MPSFKRSPLLHRFTAIQRWSAVLLLALVLGLPGAAQALTAVPRDFDALVARAESIFKGTVVAQESLWTGEGPGRRIVTRVTFQVLETLKGTAASAQTLEFLGGTVDDRTLLVPGIPTFALGDTAVLFVVGNGEQFCPLVGAHQGHFRVRRDAATAREHIFSHDGRPVADTARLGQGDAAGLSVAPRAGAAQAADGEAPLPAETFRERVLEKLRERRAQRLPEIVRGN